MQDLGSAWASGAAEGAGVTLAHKVQPLTTEQSARLLSSAVGTDWKAVVQWAAARFRDDSGCVALPLCRVCAHLTSPRPR